MCRSSRLASCGSGRAQSPGSTETRSTRTNCSAISLISFAASSAGALVQEAPCLMDCFSCDISCGRLACKASALFVTTRRPTRAVFKYKLHHSLKGTQAMILTLGLSVA